MKQVPFWGHEHTRRQTTKFIRLNILAYKLREFVGRLKTTEETKSWSRKYWQTNILSLPVNTLNRNIVTRKEYVAFNKYVYIQVWAAQRSFGQRRTAYTTVVPLLTYSMVQSPSWEANWFAASQEIRRILWNPKVHYRTHKRPPPVLILGQPNPVHIPTSHLLEIRPNIIHPSTPRSPQWSPSLRFPHQDPIRPPLLTNTRHMPSPSHSSRFYHPHNIGWGL